MRRLLRILLYLVAIGAGLVGLVSGGKSLAKYVSARMNDPYFDAFSYNDLVFSGGVICLLSLILLVFTDIALTLSQAFKPADGGKTDATRQPAGSSSKTDGSDRPATATVEMDPADRETADGKLARLLRQKDE